MVSIFSCVRFIFRVPCCVYNLQGWTAVKFSIFHYFRLIKNSKEFPWILNHTLMCVILIMWKIRNRLNFGKLDRFSLMFSTNFIYTEKLKRTLLIYCMWFFPWIISCMITSFVLESHFIIFVSFQSVLNKYFFCCFQASKRKFRFKLMQ